MGTRPPPLNKGGGSCPTGMSDQSLIFSLPPILLYCQLSPAFCSSALLPLAKNSVEGESLVRSQRSSAGRIKEELKKADLEENSGWMAKPAIEPHQTSRVNMARIGKRAGKDTMLRIGKKSGNWPLAIGPLGQVFKMWPYNLNFPS